MAGENSYQNLVKACVKEANQYKCNVKGCKHGGKLSCWPEFNKKDQDPAEFTILQDEKQLFMKEIVCYHTKLSFKQRDQS